MPFYCKLVSHFSMRNLILFIMQTKISFDANVNIVITMIIIGSTLFLIMSCYQMASLQNRIEIFIQYTPLYAFNSTIFIIVVVYYPSISCNFWAMNIFCSLGFESAAFVELMNDVSVESVLKPHQRYYSSSNSYSSSLSSISSTSSGSENVTAIRTHDLEADADSVTSTQSGLSRHEHIDSNPRKMVCWVHPNV